MREARLRGANDQEEARESPINKLRESRGQGGDIKHVQCGGGPWRKKEGGIYQGFDLAQTRSLYRGFCSGVEFLQKKSAKEAGKQKAYSKKIRDIKSSTKLQDSVWKH